RIFRLSADGYGKARIIRTLIKAGVPPFGGARWTHTYIDMLLNDQRVCGRLQPKKDDGTPDGAVIEDYYPCVISAEEYALARAGQNGRRGKGGRRDRRYVNVFQSMLVNALDGEGFQLVNRRSGDRPQLQLINSAGKAGRAKVQTFPYPVFEEAI